MNSVINNISSGIAQKKQMLKGIWSRGSSSANTSHIDGRQNKNENIDPSNLVMNGRGQSMDLGASSKIGMGTNHLNMSHTAMNMI